MASSGEEGVGVDDDASGDVDEESAVLHRGQELLVDQAPGLVRCGGEEDDHVGLREEGREVGDRGDAVPRPPCDAEYGAFEAGQAALECLTDRAVAEDQHGPIRERVVHLVVRRRPDAELLIPYCAGQVPVRRQDQPDGEFRGGRVVHTPRVAQGDALGEMRQEVLEARRLGLDHLQRGHLRDDLGEPGPAHVARHVELDRVQRRRPVTTREVLDIKSCRQPTEKAVRVLPRQPHLHPISHIPNLLGAHPHCGLRPVMAPACDPRQVAWQARSWFLLVFSGAWSVARWGRRSRVGELDIPARKILAGSDHWTGWS